MLTTQMNEIVQHLRRAVLGQGGPAQPDRQVLGCFVEHQDKAALAMLVRRHGPMVWGVCRRVLSNHHDAEDAFQATFLVLVRRAASVRPREQVGNWLYGVAHQTALKARALRARRRTTERQLTDMPEPAVPANDLSNDLQPLLDQELSRLPDKYRVAIVLCDLEGKTRKEAAQQLGLPEGTLAGRLTRGRALLARRLVRHTAALSGGSLAAILSASAASAGVPAAVMSTTIKAATLLAARQAAGEISAHVAALTEGVLKAMLMTKIRTVLGVCLVFAVLMFGSVIGYRTFAADKTQPAPRKDRLEDTLILLDKQWWEAASKYDVDTLSKILAEDWVCNPIGAHWTKAISLDHYRRSRYTEVKILTARAVVRIDLHTAIMTYEVKWRGDTKGGGQSSGHDRIVHCWVQRDGGWFVKYTECVGLSDADESGLKMRPAKPGPAWKKGVRASGTWKNETPEKAFDTQRDTDWNAGDYAPAWIERDLGATLPLSRITLFPCQNIAGMTIHEIWVSNEPIGDDRTKAKLVHTFKGHTTNQQALKFEFPKDLSARYIEIRTTQSPTWIAWWEIEIRVRDERVVPLDPTPTGTK